MQTQQIVANKCIPQWKVEIMLKEKRIEAGMTQQQLAAKAGVSMSIVSLYERNGTANAQVRIVRKLANALGCKVDDII